ncbi:MAG: formate dehydrogenase [Gammaproteobacteria bacterium]|nr:formate dehydrogenase [Gammaproteobacteria bacterium]NIR85370.1 formate dehydrogenase [Gammaproteobacteria bacterium]NIR88888.1 formate dehydrogenase [Gammaproteobacteria bacterium]NIU06496.1 formate dehydrogenase [Gammaproteobacteria bacterium]NIV53389.1 formate dehydrogenase [Gammaproteobacteria bacterium]
MKKRTTAVQKGRRGFLKNVALIGGAGTAAAVAGGAVAGVEPAPQDQAQTPEAKGYHVTPHIRTYYEKARF